MTRRRRTLTRRLRRWLKVSAHARQQLTRFGRLFAAALGVQLLAVHGPVTRDVASAAAVAAAEVAWRQYFKVRPTDPDGATAE